MKRLLALVLTVAAFQFFGVSIFPVCRPPIPVKAEEPPHWIYGPEK